MKNIAPKVKNALILIIGFLLIYTGFISISKNKINFLNSFLLLLGIIIIIYYLSIKNKEEFIPINNMFLGLKDKKVYTFLDKLTYPKIFLIWVLIVILFGFLYYALPNEKSYLLSTITKNPVYSIMDCLYFSFITATTTGFGDITPLGFFKPISIFEVVLGLVLFALVTSKLVSIKQDIILTEVYEISFNERLNRLRSSLFVFRQNILRLIGKIEEGSIKKREIIEIYTYVSSLQNTLDELLTFFGKKGRKTFIKEIDSLNTELLFNSIIQSFERINELIKLLNEKDIEWRREITLNLINLSIKSNNELFLELNNVKNIEKKAIIDMNKNNTAVIEEIKKNLKNKNMGGKKQKS